MNNDSYYYIIYNETFDFDEDQTKFDIIGYVKTEEEAKKIQDSYLLQGIFSLNYRRTFYVKSITKIENVYYRATFGVFPDVKTVLEKLKVRTISIHEVPDKAIDNTIYWYPFNQYKQNFVFKIPYIENATFEIMNEIALEKAREYLKEKFETDINYKNKYDDLIADVYHPEQEI